MGVQEVKAHIRVLEMEAHIRVQDIEGQILQDLPHMKIPLQEEQWGWRTWETLAISILPFSA